MTLEISKAISDIADAEKAGFPISDDEKRFIMRYAFYADGGDALPYIRKVSGLVKTNADELRRARKEMEAEIDLKKKAIGMVIDTIEATEEVLAFSRETLEEGRSFLEKKELLDPYRKLQNHSTVDHSYSEKLMDLMKKRKEEKEESEEAASIGRNW